MKFIKFFEPIGLSLLLCAFGFQLLSTTLEQDRTQYYFMKLSESINADWNLDFDEFYHSGRYKGSSVYGFTHSTPVETNSYWDQQQKELSRINRQIDFFSKAWRYLYVFGSILIICGKIPWKNTHTQS